MKNGKPYCRRCVSFIGEKAPVREREPTPSPLRLHYELSGEQKEISMRIQRNFLNGIDTLVYAVCGAGKTELSYGVIALALRKGLQVGFALPRRDVVIELYWRIKEAFPEDRVVAVYGEHTHALTGDIIILTTHQLYRYPHYFDLLVMDEIDAFPFKGSEVLHAMCKASIRGRVVMMSATPSKEILKEFSAPGHDIVELRTRFHKKPIPMPKTKITPRFLFAPYCVRLLKRYAKERKPCFVFVPTKALSESVFRAVSPFVKGGDYVNSSRKGRERIISDFKKGKLMYLVTTSVLERGVTIRGLQVIVYEADEESIYDSSTLIQIAGRAGRKADAPNGDVIFLAEKETKSINDARREIGFCNTFL
jgi:competence protein ComFA